MKKNSPSYLYVVYLAVILIVVILFMLFLVNTDEPKATTDGIEGDAYTLELLQERIKKDANLTDTAVSRFNEEERAQFAEKGLQYFDPDKQYRVLAEFVTDTSAPVFQMPTTTERAPNYRTYGYLHFILKDTLCKLTAYQNMDFKNSPEYDKTLFIPLWTIQMACTHMAVAGIWILLFRNLIPLCLILTRRIIHIVHYAARWSCPLVPFENDLNVSVIAGEKSYK